MSLQEFYGNAGADADIPIQLTLPKFDEEFLRRVFAGTLPEGQIDLQYYLKMGNLLQEAVNSALTDQMEASEGAALQSQLQHNVWKFAGAQTYDARMQMAKHLADEDGNPVNYETFRRRAHADGEIFNDNWRRAEYNNARRTTAAAEKWQYLQKFDALEYRTVGDGRVRKSHKDLNGKVWPTKHRIWDSIYPPNGWNCRCVVVPAQGKPENTDVKVNDAKNSIPEYFRKNAGRERVIFDEKKHPVFQRLSKNTGLWQDSQWRAVTNYGLPSAAQIYRKAENLARYQPAMSREAARAAFKPETITAADGVKVEIGEAFRSKIIEGLKKGKPEPNYKNRYRYAHLVKDVLSRPHEVWSRKEGNRMQTTFLRYYEDYPVVYIQEIRGNKAIFKSMYQLDRNPENTDLHRSGILKKYGM